jgi:hypothetical protein
MRSLGITLFTVAVMAGGAWAAQTDQASSGTASTLPTSTSSMNIGRPAQPSSQAMPSGLSGEALKQWVVQHYKGQNTGASSLTAPALPTHTSPMNMGRPAKPSSQAIPSGLSREALRQWVAQHIKGQNTATLPLNDPRLPAYRVSTTPSGKQNSAPWGREVQITNYPYVWDYSTGYTHDGNFYASYVDSSLHAWVTYKSTDDGATWNFFHSIGLGDTSVQIGFPDAFHVLTRNSSLNESNNRIYYFLGYRYGANNFFDVLYTPLDSPGVLTRASAFLTTPYTPSLVVTADWYTNGGVYFHAAYKKGTFNDTTNFITSTDNCVTWGYTSTGFTAWPMSMEMGDTFGQYVKMAFNYIPTLDTMDIFFNADTSFGLWTSWIGDQNTLRRTSGRRFHPKLLSIQREGSFSGNVIWIAYQRYPYPYNLYYVYSRDGGLTWPDSTTVGPLLDVSTTAFNGDILGWGNNYPDAFWRRLSGSGTDSLIYSFSYEGNPSTWNVPFGVNTVEPDNYTDPGVVYSSRQIGPGVIFAGQDVGGYAQGLYFDSGWITSGVEKGGAVVRGANLELGSAKPNPFSRTTAIAFSLPKSGNVELAVYDIAGRKVATLANGTMTAGSHEASFNGSGVPAGVYFYRLAFEGKTLTNRMVVVR